MWILSMFMTLATFTFIFLKHPLTMGLILLTQTILIALYTGLMNLNFWFSYILILIMIGGMLILFIYMTSIASNEMFKFKKNLLISMIILMLFFLILYLFFTPNFFIKLDTIDYFYNFNKLNIILSKFLNYPSNMILFFMIIYLLITLIAIVKITNIKYGPLRQKF